MNYQATTAPILALAPPGERLLSVIERGKSDLATNTYRAYRAAARRFAVWCEAEEREAFPCAPATVAEFLAAEERAGRAPSTIALRVAALAYAHAAAGYSNPCATALVRSRLRGIRRRLSLDGYERREAPALTLERLAVVLAKIDRTTLRGIRDAAVFTFGFALAARRSEMAALDVADLDDDGEGFRVRIRRSKTDQTGEGALLYVPPARNPAVCPVRGLRAWLEAAEICEGAVFRAIDRHGRVGSGISSDALNDRVRSRSSEAGLDGMSAHSLRAGLVTTLAERGLSETAIMIQSRHKSSAMVRRYTRLHNARAACPLVGLY